MQLSENILSLIRQLETECKKEGFNNALDTVNIYYNKTPRKPGRKKAAVVPISDSEKIRFRTAVSKFVNDSFDKYYSEHFSEDEIDKFKAVCIETIVVMYHNEECHEKLNVLFTHLQSNLELKNRHNDLKLPLTLLIYSYRHKKPILSKVRMYPWEMVQDFVDSLIANHS